MREFDDRYAEIPQPELYERIRAAKEKLGGEVLILAHHYQPQETFQFADVTGDSLKLSEQAATAQDARYIVFCGVYFMAEVARTLCGQKQRVILPDFSAGCYLANTASAEALEQAWSHIGERFGGQKVVPVFYINSSAAIKAFCGRHDGVICTSGNASAVMSWALERGDIVLFAPDQHLGRNTAVAMGMALADTAPYNPELPDGGMGQLHEQPRVILWPGCCNVHMYFTVDDIARVRREHPNVRVIVHPECRYEVVRAADMAGSTEAIIRAVEQSEDGSVWAVGTEKDMVDRLAEKMKGRKTVMNLSPLQTYCETMKRCTAARLLWVLENLAAGQVVNEVFVNEHQRHDALVALQRMLALRSENPGTIKR